MKIKIKEFLHKIEKEEPENHILYRKIYKNPSEVFNIDMDQINKDIFYDYNIVNRLILNNSFLELLDIIFEDTDYISRKLDYYILKSIQAIILDSEYFVDNIEDKDIYKYSIKNIQSVRFSKSFKDSLPVYGLSYTIRKNKYNLKLSHYIRNKLLKLLNLKEDEQIRPIEQKINLYNKILCDDYKKPNTCVLCLYDVYSSYILNACVCDNFFLDVIKSMFLNKNMDKIIIDRLIKILELSIKICKETQKGNVNYYEFGNIINKEKIKEYNIQEAVKILSKLKNELKDTKRKIYNLNNFIQR